MSTDPPSIEQQPIANLNGQTMPLSEANVPVLDRGFLFGDAVYEVIRVYQGKPWLFQEHMDRLRFSLQEIRIQGVDVPRLQERIEQMLNEYSFGEATIYIQITRGVAPRKHAFPQDTQPLELFYIQEFVDSYKPLRETGAKAITFPDLRWQRCDIKSTNLLGNVLAMQAATEAGCAEALLYKPDDTVSEGTHTSLFAVSGGMLITTPQGTSILPGITRSLILNLARQQIIPVRERIFSREDLTQFAEVFVTGTTSEILPLVQIDDQPIADCQPGPITRQLQQAYRVAVEAFLG